jgi:hypothetical protein
MPPFFITDAADAELLTVELLFGWEIKAFICHWYAQRAWQKQLAAKVCF